MARTIDFRLLDFEPLSELRQRATKACETAHQLRQELQDALDAARDFNDREWKLS